MNFSEEPENEFNNQEISTSNNIHYLPFTLTTTRPASRKILSNNLRPYNLNIWNLSGQTIISKTIESKSEEDFFKSNLQRDLYFIQFKNKIYKYYSN